MMMGKRLTFLVTTPRYPDLILPLNLKEELKSLSTLRRRWEEEERRKRTGGGALRVSAAARDRGNNRKALQKGRYLSIEAIQTVQALKRAHHHNNDDAASLTKFSRLLKIDMMAVLRELLRQSQCLLSLRVFEQVRKEHWYKPQVSLYADLIGTMAANGFLEQVELLYGYLRNETHLLLLEPQTQTEGFNALLTTLLTYKLTHLVMECYHLMKALGCETDRPTFRFLINGLSAIGEISASAVVKQDALTCYGQSLEVEEEDDE